LRNPDKVHMKILLSMTILMMLGGCDAPRRTRDPYPYTGENNQTNNYQGHNFNPGSTGTDPSQPYPNNNTQTQSGYESCDLSNRFYSVDIGHFGICQSTLNESLLKFRSSLGSPTVRTCLIPTYKDSSGASTYIGNPQCLYTTASQVTEGRLFKDRTGFTNYPLNGVIVMKEPLIPEYINCMNAYSNWPGKECTMGINTSQYCGYWIPRCPNGGKTSSVCDAEARNYMGRVCNGFKTKYSNAYVDIRLK
jgi:hypothetical protein